jgi:hypothetical protein
MLPMVVIVRISTMIQSVPILHVCTTALVLQTMLAACISHELIEICVFAKRFACLVEVPKASPGMPLVTAAAQIVIKHVYYPAPLRGSLYHDSRAAFRFFPWSDMVWLTFRKKYLLNIFFTHIFTVNKKLWTKSPLSSVVNWYAIGWQHPWASFVPVHRHGKFEVEGDENHHIYGYMHTDDA